MRHGVIGDDVGSFTTIQDHPVNAGIWLDLLAQCIDIRKGEDHGIQGILTFPGGAGSMGGFTGKRDFDTIHG